MTSLPDGDFNVGGRGLVSTRTIAERVVSLTRSSSSVRSTPMLGHATRVSLDSSRASEVLGYQARMALDEGLAAVITERLAAGHA